MCLCVSSKLPKEESASCWLESRESGLEWESRVADLWVLLEAARLESEWNAVKAHSDSESCDSHGWAGWEGMRYGCDPIMDKQFSKQSKIKPKTYTQCCMLAILTFERQKQKNHKFKTSLSQTGRACLKPNLGRHTHHKRARNFSHTGATCLNQSVETSRDP